ncbi:hypothetical protein A3H10_03700 [Candidatus Uhrbacteria bacterium RIFCSPLOWO2_12_FULL_46_10]|uniref:SbsA Ig-like domain-containing protein n=1 Tax=Candidatus Uhrbacteria bacterium RIFCSPLOWO2_01_FULL_47_25 TaxID=1802402 RepID=A0A1F7UTV9_9BACT|nr:MAG: hypothetical protein UX68_C0029G0011 [Parcubacteria group bacterium GW2011_GWA2_46_9]OGL59534.1 MAG: hypothetical protein A2752_04765 [Candidatus Uhrbacteria bacterium RIFCSPHIGHO2_01_FULL_46_23]OGL69359.1 MAG: hypothetical protein A3D60_05530 [Candidatus Uhrbacteria bacterium RIFCSPHIGHO2_02_FULL_47_29]OGL74994.1 MAG: hypothetical protein A3E96_02610 [Candidatus Uhrbacteria bacterium RIFCSPHIGHO2_12_FULL_46_13]OGL81743.1 MAG: hypothetical protein A2936_04980 [Candidatus Uhrbacteria bac
MTMPAIIIFFLVIVVGLVLTFLGWRKWRTIDSLNPVPSSPKLFIIGLVLMVIGVVGVGIILLKKGVFIPEGKRTPKVEAPKPFSVIASSPADGVTAPRNAIVQIFFNRAVNPADVFIRVSRKDSESALQPVPGSIVVVNEPDGGSSEVKSSMVWRTLLPCGEAAKRENCLEESKQYVVELEGKRIYSLKGDETLNCGDKGICTFTFATTKEIDKSAPKVKFSDNLSLPASKEAKVFLSAEDDSGVAYSRLTLDHMQSKSKYLGLAIGASSQQKPITIDVADITTPSHHFITAEVFDIAGYRQEVTTVAGFYQNHCFNEKQDESEVGEDCGGPDCEACQAPREEKPPR